jgi:uncharacterized protein GlcG (DUF336 family)
VSKVRQIASISRQAALEVLAAAERAAEAAGQRSAIAVVDAAGHLCAFARMDGAPVQGIQIAQDKAYTAAGFGMPTSRWPELMAEDAAIAAGAAAGIDRLVAIGGGLPLVVDGHVVGGIGVSGGRWTDDVAVAEAGAAVLA